MPMWLEAQAASPARTLTMFNSWQKPGRRNAQIGVPKTGAEEGPELSKRRGRFEVLGRRGRIKRKVEARASPNNPW